MDSYFNDIANKTKRNNRELFSFHQIDTIDIITVKTETCEITLDKGDINKCNPFTRVQIKLDHFDENLTMYGNVKFDVNVNVIEPIIRYIRIVDSNMYTINTLHLDQMNEYKNICKSVQELSTNPFFNNLLFDGNIQVSLLQIEFNTFLTENDLSKITVSYDMINVIKPSNTLSLINRISFAGEESITFNILTESKSILNNYITFPLTFVHVIHSLIVKVFMGVSRKEFNLKDVVDSIELLFINNNNENETVIISNQLLNLFIDNTIPLTPYEINDCSHESFLFDPYTANLRIKFNFKDEFCSIFNNDDDCFLRICAVSPHIYDGTSKHRF